ncbi:nitrate/nitrite transporter NrtS [Microcystis aeruginosa]|nr:nitrate/nitrite transporter NrtS [Microcystis aeruginosa]
MPPRKTFCRKPYLVPYLVNVHGQYSSYRRQQWPKKSQE